MSGEAIKIAVRVRPFNADEAAENQKCCVDMTKTAVIIKDLVEDKDDRTFTFDHAMWSHDKFTTDEKGYHHPADPKYVDQLAAWNMLGVEILVKSWGGLNTTLFAYGQTGSGKSYTQFGYGANRGIIPKCAEELFKRIEANTDATLTFEVTVRIIEIYCEKLQDLLVDKSKKGAKDLDIRQIAGKITIPGAETKPVRNYKEIQQYMDMGDKNRSVGGTKLNATSSRAHTVVTIIFTKITKNPMAGKPPLKTEAEINLVDLAGSEKSAQAGTTGDSLKEGNAINQSLTSLGNVISALADISTGKNKTAFIPYRDSNLTRMLQNALGGNSSTIMVCAIRPGHTFYEETLNTLKYADRAKKIKNKPVINESPQDKIIRELQAENAKLREAMIAGGGSLSGRGDGGGDPEMAEKLKKAQEEMEANQRQIEEMEKSWEAKLAAAEADNVEEEKRQAEEAEARASGRPQLLNLNEDGMLNRKVFFDLSKVVNCQVGRKQHEGEGEDPNIVLGSVGIQSHHAYFKTMGDGTYLEALDKAAVPFIFVNGHPLKDMKPRLLKANDRIIFGTGSCFLFRHEDKAGDSEVQDSLQNPVTVEFAMNEKLAYENKADAAQKEADKIKQQAETDQKLQELNDKMSAERALKDAEQLALIAEFEAKMKAMQDEIDNKKDDQTAQDEALEKEAKMRVDMEKQIEEGKMKNEKDENDRQERIRKEEIAIRNRQAEFSALEKKLGVVLPLVSEANLIAKELKRKITFSTKMIRIMPEFGNLLDSKTDVVIKVDNAEEGYYYQWEQGKFQGRLAMMRDLLSQFFDDGTLPALVPEKDPFWDPPEPLCVGISYLSLKNLGYMLQNDLNAKILSSEGEKGQRGQLTVKYEPCDAEGNEPEDDMQCDEPHELVGKEVNFRVEIDEASGLPADLCKNVFVRYQFKHEPGVIYQTDEFDGVNQNPKFNYKKIHNIDLVTDYIIDYIDSGNIAFKVFAYPKFTVKTKTQAVTRPGAKAAVKAPPKKAEAKPVVVQTKTSEQTTSHSVEKVEKTGGSSCCNTF